MGHWKVRMIYWDEQGKRHNYDRFVTAYDRDEAMRNALDERLESEIEDEIDCVSECSEKEFDDGCLKVNDGWRGVI